MSHLAVGLLHTLGYGLLGETLLIGAVDGIGYKVVVLHTKDGLRRQEREQRLLVLCQACQLGHNLHLVAAVLRQLVLHLEGANAVYLVAKEVNAVGQLAAEREYVEYGAAQRKLTWFVHIVNLAEAEVAQCLLNVRRADGLSRRKRQRAAVESPFRYDHLGHSFGVGDDIQQT